MLVTLTNFVQREQESYYLQKEENRENQEESI